jgi:hypothetical protein
MKGGWLIYKCRKCDEKYQNTHTSDLSTMLFSVIIGGNCHKQSEIIPDMLDLHYCNAKNVGIADLIGGIKDDE